MSTNSPNNILLKTKYHLEDDKIYSDLYLLLTPSSYKHSFGQINRGFYENARFSTINKLNFSDPAIQHIPRAGLIYFTFINDELYMCLGKDKKTNDITDFSGLRKKYENPINCALREGYEESRKVFGIINENQISKFICLYSTQMLIVFVPVISPSGTDIRQITTENFNNKHFLNEYQYDHRCYNEISEIQWFNEQELENMFSVKSNYKMYTKVRRFIYSCRPFSENITQMKSILRNGLISQETYELYQLQFRKSGYSKTSRKNFPRKQKFQLKKSCDSITEEETITISNLDEAIINSLE